MQNFCELKVSNELYEFLVRDLFIKNEFLKRTEIWKSDPDRKHRSLNYLSIKDGLISYIDTSKYNITPDINPFSSEFDSKRILTSPGRIFIKLFPNSYTEISPRFVESFSNSFKAYVNRNKVEVKVVSGNDIKRYYREESYSSGSGSLNKSCMRSSSAQNFLDIYVDNCKMLVAFKGGRVISRAILWDDVTCLIDGVISKINFMDRVYVSQDSDLSYMTDWAKSNNYAYKLYQNYENKTDIVIDGQSKRCVLFVKIPKLEKYRNYPYIDTFTYSLHQTDFLTNQAYVKSKGGFRYVPPYKCFTSTGGGYSGNQHESWQGSRENKRFESVEYFEYLNWINKILGYSYPTKFEELLKIREEEERIKREEDEKIKREHEERRMRRIQEQERLRNPNTVPGRIRILDQYRVVLNEFIRCSKSMNYVFAESILDYVYIKEELNRVEQSLYFLSNFTKEDTMLEPLDGDLFYLTSLYEEIFRLNRRFSFDYNHMGIMTDYDIIKLNLNLLHKQKSKAISLIRGENSEKPLYLLK